jgi:hypothetical protein
MEGRKTRIESQGLLMSARIGLNNSAGIACVICQIGDVTGPPCDTTGALAGRSYVEL